MASRSAWGPAPAEVTAPPANEYAYEEWRKADTLRAPYKVSGALLRGIRTDAVEHFMECPLLCFVNARSGGRVGVELALLMSRAIGRVQVFDIGDKDGRPDKVLSKFYENLRALEAAGDPRAGTLRQRLRLLVCGGDGTIAWVMGVLKKLRLQPEPPVAIMPLGTGNDLSRSFLWGPAYDKRWIRNYNSMYNTLHRIAAAVEDKLDCWQVIISAPRRAMFTHGLPHCLSTPAAATSPQPQPGQLPPPSTHARLSTAPPAPSSNAGIVRGYSSGLISGAAAAAATTTPCITSVLGLHSAGRDSSIAGATTERSVAGTFGDRSVPVSVVATHGSATPLHNIATSSVGSAATTFTTATNMSLHTGAAQAGTSVPPTIVSGAVSTAEEEDAGAAFLTGMFWNYFSVGLDAKAAWGFHSLREERPTCTSSRTANQLWYSFFSCTSGWFCCAQPLNVKVTLEVLRPGPGGEFSAWEPVKLPPNVKALVVLNLQSYAGGRNLWGPRTSAAERRKHGFKPPSYNDGLLEVVGLQSGWHTGLVMASKGTVLHARRICQAAGVRLSVNAPYVRADGEPSHCYMQIDGEPWKQDIPVRGQETPVRVEIVHAGVSRVLRNDPPARARNLSSTAATSSKSPSQQLSPLVNAVSEPGTSSPPAAPLVAISQSQSSLQMPVVQSAPQVGSGPSPGGPTPSTSGVLQPQQVAVTHGSQSGAAPAAWTRLGSVGRPSATSVAGSSSVDVLASEGGGGGGGGGRVAPAGGRQGGDGTEGGTVAVEPPTPRTLSTDMGSQGGRSVAMPE